PFTSSSRVASALWSRSRVMDTAALAEIPLFAGLSDEERAEVAACMRDIEAEAGTTLTTQGDNAYQLFVIESGTAEVRQDGNVIRTVGPGDVFGEIGILATGSRTAFVVATSPVRLAALYIREFKQLERRMPQLTEALQKVMAERRPWTSA